MKSYVIMLGAAVSLSSAAWAQNRDYWEDRDVTPADEDQPPERNYYENRSVAPGEEDVRPERDYYENRDTNPGDPDDAREAEELLDQRSMQRTGEPDRSTDRRDMLARDPEDRRMGLEVQTGGGIGGFVDDRISEVTSPQGQWTGRLVIGTRRHLGGEVAYVGSAQRVNTFGISPNSTLFGNGAEGAARLNVLTGMWQPYAIAGLGFVHYSLNDSAVLTTSDVQRSSTVLTVPVGVGMAWRMNGIVLDSRLSFHPATSAGLIRGTNLSTWDLQAKAGFEF